MAGNKGGLTLRGRIGKLLRQLTAQSATEAADGMSMPPAAKRDAAFRFSGLLTAAILLLVLLFCAALGARAYRVLGMGANQYKNVPVLYLQQGDTLKFSSPLLEQPVTVNAQMATLSGDFGTLEQSVWVSGNNRKLLYLNNLQDGYGDLYYREIASERPGNADNDSRGVLVARQVQRSSVSFVQDDKAVVYLRTDAAGERQLCHWRPDGTETVYADRVQRLCFVSPSGEVCMVATGDEGLELQQLTIPKKPNGTVPVQIVDTGLELVQKVDDNQTVYYTKGGEFPTSNLYAYSAGDAEPRQVATGVSTVLDIGARGECFYLQTSIEEFDPFLYFEDDMAAADEALREPAEEDFLVETKNLWGRVTKSVDKKAYDAAVEEFAAKQQRDAIRNAIGSGQRSYWGHTLYHNAGSSQTVVDAGLRAVQSVDAAGAVAVYYKERSAITEKFRISQIADPQEALRLVDTVLSNTVRDYYYVRLGSEAQLFQTVAKGEVLVTELDGNRGLYFIKGSNAATDGKSKQLDEQGGALYYAQLESDGLGLAKKLDDGVLSVDSRSLGQQRLYQKRTGTTGVDLYGVQDGKHALVVQNISQMAGYTIEDEQLLGYRDYHPGRLIGELVAVDGKVQTLAERANDYSYRTRDYIYILADYDEGEERGTLYLYTGGKKLTVVDRNVSALAG